MDTNFLVKNTFLELKSKFPYYLATILPFAIIEEFLSSLESVIPSMLFSILVLPFLNIEIYEAVKNNRKPSPLNILNFFSSKVIVTSILVSIYTFLWTLLLIIPGIIKSISYQRAIYNSHNDESISSGQAIKDSMKQMNGLKSTYFISRIFISLPNLLITFILGFLSISHFTDVISVKYHLYTNFTIMTLIMLVVSVITTVALSIFDGVFNSEMENTDSRY